LKEIKITRVEDRARDAWFDLSLRQIREGVVRFYRVQDFLTGEWLFKVCLDEELGKVIVKAVKCPPGRRFSQLEGNTMLFQKSLVDDSLYDIISLTHADENDKLYRKVAGNIEEVPAIIREHFTIKSYEEATGKKAPGKNWVTLTRKDDDKAIITLFLLERAWTLSPVSFEERTKNTGLTALIKNLEMARIEDVHQTAAKQLGLSKDEVDAVLDSMKKKEQIKYLEGAHVKTI
jgi:hypothetical protein